MIHPSHLRSFPRSPRVRSQAIQNVASADPVLAATLAAGLEPGGYADIGGWEIVTLAGRWDQPEAGQNVLAQQFSSTPGGARAAGLGPLISVPGLPRGQSKGGGGVLEANLWLRAVRYTVRRPNAFQTAPADLIFKAQSDWTNSQNPNIDVTLQLVTPFCRAEVSIPPTPLENMPVSFDTSFPAGFFSRSDAQINCTMVNTRDWSVTDGELPVEAIVALHCWRLPLGAYDRFNQEAAKALLLELGYSV